MSRPEWYVNGGNHISIIFPSCKNHIVFRKRFVISLVECSVIKYCVSKVCIVFVISNLIADVMFVISNLLLVCN